MSRKNTCFICIALLLSAKVFSQDPIFLNAQQALIDLNPSFAGSNGLLRLQSTCQVIGPQFDNSAGGLSKITGTYITAFTSLDAYIKPIKGGISFSYMHDNQFGKTVQSDFFNLGYAQHFSVFANQLKIVPSLQASVISNELDRSLLHFGDLINPRYGYTWNVSESFPAGKKYNFNLSSGLLLSVRHFYIGAAVFNFNRPNIGLLGDFRMPARLVAHASYNLHLPAGNIIYFFGRYEKQQSYIYSQYGLSVLLLKHFIFGGSYINSNTPTATVGLRGHFINCQLNYGYTTGIKPFNLASTIQLSFSVHIRSLANRRLFTDFESW